MCDNQIIKNNQDQQTRYSNRLDKTAEAINRHNQLNSDHENSYFVVSSTNV